MTARAITGRSGIPLALLSAALFGASTPFAKLLLGAVDPWLLAGLLYLGSGIGLAALRLCRRAHEAPLKRADLPWLAGAVASGGVIGPLLLMIGLARTSAASTALLLNLEGVLTLAIAWVVFRENLDGRILAGAAAILAGAAILSWQGGALTGDVGALAIVGACLAWAIDNNVTRKLSAADPVAIASLKGLAAGAINLALALLVARDAWPGREVVLAAGIIGFLGYGVSLALFVLALRHLGAARTGAYFATAPFVGAVLAVLLLGDPVTPRLGAAAALMAIGLWLHVTERHVHEHTHAPLVHEHRHVHDAHHRHEHGPEIAPGEPHSHVHAHARLVHRHPHYPDIHHRHGH